MKSDDSLIEIDHINVLQEDAMGTVFPAIFTCLIITAGCWLPVC